MIKKWLYPSLFVQIYLLFFVSIVISAIITYSLNISSLREKEEKIISQTTFLAQQSMLELINGNIRRIQTLIKNYGFVRVDKIPKEAVVIYKSSDSLAKMQIFKIHQDYGFGLEYLGESYIAQKNFKEQLSFGNNLNWWILLDFLILFLTFAIILAILHPMKILRNSLEEFSKGNYKVRIKVPKEPEQALLARSFNAMAIKISKLMEVREFILRNIGHELKTPISKAKLALELMPPNPQKEILNKAIKNLDELTSQILTFEKVQEGKDLLEFKEFFVETLVLETLNHIFVDEAELEIQIQENFKIFGDLNFLSIALKNLIENARKYKSDGKIEVFTQKRDKERFCLGVSNEGERLQKNIQEYFEPFYRDKKHELTQGYGLGLGIIKGILEMHHLKLEYQYKANRHYFMIIFKAL